MARRHDLGRGRRLLVAAALAALGGCLTSKKGASTEPAVPRSAAPSTPAAAGSPAPGVAASPARAASGAPLEELKRRGERVFFRKCAASSPASAVCPPLPAQPAWDHGVGVPATSYFKALDEVLDLPRLTARTTELGKTRERLVTALSAADKALKAWRLPPDPVVPPGDEDAAAGAAAAKVAAEEEKDKLTTARERASAAVVAHDRAAAPQLAAFAEARKTRAQVTADLGSPNANGRTRRASAAVTDVAFAPFRFTPLTCPAGAKWNAGASGCCRGSTCRASAFDAPKCEIVAAALDGQGRFRAVVKLAGGTPTRVRFGAELRECPPAADPSGCREQVFGLVFPNTSTLSREETLKAQVLGAGGTADCQSTVTIDPNCLVGTRWHAGLACCAASAACRCDLHTSEGYRWACGEAGTPGERCFARGTSERRLTCAAGQVAPKAKAR